MDKKRKTLGILAIALVMTALVNSVPVKPNAHAQGSAELSGQVYDHGTDADADGLLDFLIVDVEVNVYTAADYRLEVNGLVGYYSYNPWESQVFYLKNIQIHLETGLQNVSVSFSGVRIFSLKLNVTKIWGINLHDEHYSHLGYIYEAPLSRIYGFDEFDIGAVLTGYVFGAGVDTDDDGLFNYLDVATQVNVSDAGSYRVSISGLTNETGQHASVANATEIMLTPGLQTVNVSLPSSGIYSSRILNISQVESINLYFADDFSNSKTDHKIGVLLDTFFNYDQFNTLGYFTGTILDLGVDEDSDGMFDYLQIRLEVNATRSGDYRVELHFLTDNSSVTDPYMYLFQSVVIHLDPGLILVNFTVYGPQIYGERFNPSLIGEAELYSSLTHENLDSLAGAALSVLYSYAQFESHAAFTGNIVDYGVDTDSDGLFDYLAVGIEVNVTEAGRYRVQCSALTDEMHGTLFQGQYREDSFTVGVQRVYLNFSGSMLAYYHFSPANLTYVYLYETDPYIRLGYAAEMALSTSYSYINFNAPLEDMDLKLTVYPNSTMGIDGTYNYTHIYPNMYPMQIMPRMNTTFGISTSDGVTSASANGTVEVPSYVWPGEWPFNATTAIGISKLQGGLLNTTLSSSVIMPSTYPANASNFVLNASYAGGLFNLDFSGDTNVPSSFWTGFTMYPELQFNQSDITVLADYNGNEITGNITFYTVSSFPLSNVMVFFSGNRTNLTLAGNLTVIYGDYFGTTYNSTTVDEMLSDFNSTFLGPTGIVYNETEGLLEGTEISTTKEPLTSNGTEHGATIEYSAEIQGNFTGFMAKLVAAEMNPYDPDQNYGSAYAILESAFSSIQHGSLEADYWHTTGTGAVVLHLTGDARILWDMVVELVPPTVPASAPAGFQQQVEAWLKIANVTAYNVQDFSLNASYSSTTERLDLEAAALLTPQQLKNDVIPHLPEAIAPNTRPDLQDIVRSFVNTTYCNVTLFDGIVSWSNGLGSFDFSATLEGDFRLETNHARKFGCDYMKAISSGQLPWYVRMLNLTDVDIDNFRAELTMREDSMFLSFSGLILQPVKDDVDSVQFKFSRFFNAAYDSMEPPQQFQKLKITVVGCSNSTHTVLLDASPYVPFHETSLNSTIMSWEMRRLSGLWDLRFDVAFLGRIDYLAKTYYVPVFTNSTVTNFRFDPDQRSVLFNVSAPSGTGFSEVTIPKALVNSDTLDEWRIYMDGRLLNSTEFSISDNAEYVFINLNYTHSEHEIQIMGTWVVPEYQLPIVQILLATLGVMIVLVALRHKRKLAKVNYIHNTTVRTLLKRLTRFIP